MLRLASSLNFKNADEPALGGMAGAFQNSTRLLPMALCGAAGFSAWPQPMAAAARSMASINPLGFM